MEVGTMVVNTVVDVVAGLVLGRLMMRRFDALDGRFDLLEERLDRRFDAAERGRDALQR